MAIENISLAIQTDGYDHEGHNGIRFHQYWDAGYGPRDVRLVWSTMYGSDTFQKSFTVSVSYYGVRKGQLGQSTPATVTATIPASQCHETHNGRYWWSHDLNFGGLLSKLINGSAWTYANRLWDGLTFDVTITANWLDGTSSPAYKQTVWINYVPVYSLVACYYNTAGDLTIKYTATDWTRADDRWSIDYGTINGQDAFLANTWGTVNGYGEIIVPKSRIRCDLTQGMLNLKVRFNAQWRPVDMEFATMSTSLQGTSNPQKETPTDPGTKVNDWTKIKSVDERMYQANTPLLSVQSATAYGVAVRVSDTGDLGKPIKHVIVKLDGAKYSVDCSDVSVGGSGWLYFPPLGKSFKVFAYGLDDAGGVSNAATAIVKPIKPQGTVLQLLSDPDPAKALILRYRKSGESIKPKVTVKPNVETVQLSGRRRACSYYGDGGSTQIDFSGWVVPELETDEDNMHGEKYEALPEQGDFMCRFTDGRRYAITGQVTISPDEAANTQVSVSGDEVEA